MSSTKMKAFHTCSSSYSSEAELKRRPEIKLRIIFLSSRAFPNKEQNRRTKTMHVPTCFIRIFCSFSIPNTKNPFHFINKPKTSDCPLLKSTPTNPKKGSSIFWKFTEFSTFLQQHVNAQFNSPQKQQNPQISFKKHNASIENSEFWTIPRWTERANWATQKEKET